MSADRFDAIAVHNNWPDLAGLLLSQIKRAAGFEAPHIPDRDSRKTAGALVVLLPTTNRAKSRGLSAKIFLMARMCLVSRMGSMVMMAPFFGGGRIGHVPSYNVAK